MNQLVLWTGYATLGALLIVAALLCAIGITKLFNRATWAIVGMYGGIKTLREFQHWYANGRIEKSEPINHD